MFKRYQQDVEKITTKGLVRQRQKPKIEKTKDEKLMCQKVVKIERKKDFFLKNRKISTRLIKV